MAGRPQDSGYVGTRIRDILAARERTMAWLARHMGVSDTLVWLVVNGQRNITPDFAARASRALDLPADTIFVKRADVRAGHAIIPESNVAEEVADACAVS